MVDVRIPQGTTSHYLVVSVLKRRLDRSDYTVQDWWQNFPDGAAHDTTFRARLPRGEYRLVVGCQNAALVDQRIRLVVSRSLVIPLVPRPGQGDPSVSIP